MAHLPAATTATSTPTTPEHIDHGHRLRAHAVELWLGESSISVQIICPDASRSPNFLIWRTRECCASKFVRAADSKDADARRNHAGLCGLALFLCDEQKCRLPCCLCTRPNLCRACLRTLICESERAEGGAHACVQSEAEQSPARMGKGNDERSNGHPDDQGPRDHWPKCCHTRAISALAHSYSVLEGRLLVPSFPSRRHLRGPAQLLPTLLCLRPPPTTTPYQWP